ncbi:MAG: glycosyltransferase family 87 protein [Pseudomonadota bacterium]
MSAKWLSAAFSKLAIVQDERLKFCLLAAPAMAILFAIMFDPLFLQAGIVGTESQQDYAAFHGAGRAALQGFDGNLYNPIIFQEVLGSETTLLWLYPPHMLFALIPFGVFSYSTAKWLMIAVVIGAAYLVCRLASGSRLLGVAGIFSPASFAALFVGQIGGLFALMMTAGLILVRKRPYLAGACLGLLTIKPQLGLLIVSYLLLERAWKTIITATFVAGGLVVVSVAVFGIDMWGQFFSSLLEGTHAAYYESSGHSGRFTLSDALKGIGIVPPSAPLLYGPLILLAIMGQFFLAKKNNHIISISYTLIATAAVSPYMFAYDYLIVHAGLLIVMTNLNQLGRLPAWCLAALWFSPLMVFMGAGSLTPSFAWPLTLIGSIIVFGYGMGFWKQKSHVHNTSTQLSAA